MKTNNSWLLPDGIDEFLPPQAVKLEHQRRSLLKLFHTWGYEQVAPPMVEFLDSLLVGTANDLESDTFKLTDPVTGRLVGIRADMTPQVARIDAHRLKTEGPSRLCYFGHVLLTHARELGGSRNPVQCGAELFGCEDIAADLEIINLMMSALCQAKLSTFYVDLGHVSVFRSLASQAKLSTEIEDQLFDALQRKAQPEILTLLDGVTDKKTATMLASLTSLNGDAGVLVEAREKLAAAEQDVHHALDELQQVADQFKQRWPDKILNIDLAELRGYQYHTGLVFSAYAPGYGQAIAVGGRYNGIGEVFGRNRPATGFSIDLTAVLALDPKSIDKRGGIFAPAIVDDLLVSKVAELRAAGERVIQELPGQNQDAAALHCDKLLVKKNSDWVIESLRK